MSHVRAEPQQQQQQRDQEAEAITTQQVQPAVLQISEPAVLQISEPHPQAAETMETEGGRRRLASAEYLVALVRDANDATTRHAVKSVGTFCSRELAVLCAGEVQLVQSTFRITNGNVASPLLIEALRHTHVCLATKSDQLDPPCLDAMVAAFLEPKHPATTGDKGPSELWQQPPLPPVDSVNEQERHHHHHRQRRPAHKIRSHDENDSSDAARREQATPGLHVYVINNGVDHARVNDHAIDQWGDHYRHHHRRHQADGDGGTHPLVWLLVMPFFCVGLFVSVKFMIAYLKKRRASGGGTGLLFATPSHEYVPLKAPESPSQE